MSDYDGWPGQPFRSDLCLPCMSPSRLRVVAGHDSPDQTTCFGRLARFLWTSVAELLMREATTTWVLQIAHKPIGIPHAARAAYAVKALLATGSNRLLSQSLESETLQWHPASPTYTRPCDGRVVACSSPEQPFPTGLDIVYLLLPLEQPHKSSFVHNH